MPSVLHLKSQLHIQGVCDLFGVNFCEEFKVCIQIGFFLFCFVLFLHLDVQLFEHCLMERLSFFAWLHCLCSFAGCLCFENVYLHHFSRTLTLEFKALIAPPSNKSTPFPSPFSSPTKFCFVLFFKRFFAKENTKKLRLCVIPLWSENPFPDSQELFNPAGFIKPKHPKPALCPVLPLQIPQCCVPGWKTDFNHEIKQWYTPSGSKVVVVLHKTWVHRIWAVLTPPIPQFACCPHLVASWQHLPWVVLTHYAFII